MPYPDRSSSSSIGAGSAARGDTVKTGLAAPSFTVRERALRFEVNLGRYLGTGLFLDHRETRRLVADMAEGRSFLNLFAYTGSFTVCAAAGGARRTVTVDLSRTYQDWSRRNLRHNRLNDAARHRLVHTVAGCSSASPKGG